MDVQQIKHLSAFYTHVLQCCSDDSVIFLISHFVCRVFDKKPLPGYLVFCIKETRYHFLSILYNIIADIFVSVIFMCKPSLRLRSPFYAVFLGCSVWGLSTFWEFYVWEICLTHLVCFVSALFFDLGCILINVWDQRVHFTFYCMCFWKCIFTARFMSCS